MEVNLSEVNMGNTAESVQRFLESQKNLFHGQIDQLQKIVVTQCKLTGVNPLSQEMAAGALSIKIGKRPRDLLNPKAVKYMQSVFSIKDVISKKESREISALFGVTVTQVRDFFTSQRSRVRKVARLSREKSIISNAIEAPQTGVSTSFEPMPTINPLPLSTFGLTNVDEAPIPMNSVSLTSVEENSVPLNSVCLTCVDEALVPLNSFGPTRVEEALIPMNIVFPTNVDAAPVPLNTVDPTSVGEAPSCSTQDEALPGIDGADKHFVENIFSLMRKEETFSGQVKLMEWILQIQNSLVLNWFLTKGGVMILATWLSEAATEEQTSVLFAILKVLCHLPLHKALPVHMSVILQSVNILRFYRTSGLSNRARQLLARWSKIFARAQAVKKPNGMISYIDEQKEIMLNQSISQVMAEETWHSKINTPEEFALSHENSENSRNLEPQKAMKLLPYSADDPNMKNIRGSRERRKILLVEQPGQKSGGRNQQVTRAGPASQGRPMSADDIQKAKMRAQFMQTKHGKTNGVKNEGSSKPIAVQASALHLASKALLRPPIEEYKKPITVAANTEPSLDPKESLLEKCTRVQIPWQTPPEVIISCEWGVGVGENSKEVEIQKNRLCRERESIYQKLHEIPHNPKNPWDNEMDYDDSLTPEIPTEQPPDPDNTLTEASSLITEYENRTIDTISGVSSLATGSRSEHQASTSAPEPDLELLAVLLKNPDLVFALTSGQAGNMSSEDTVRLLDMIKNNAGGLLNGLSGKAKVEERVEVSLPSPTPSSEPGTSGWRLEVNNNPFSKHTAMENHPSITRPQQVTNAPQLQQHFHTAIPSYSNPQTTTIIPERSRFTNNALEYQNDLDNPTLHSPTPSTRNYAGEAWLPRQVESSNNIKPSTISISMNASDRTPMQFSLPHPIPENPHLIPSYNRQPGYLEPRRARQSLGSNPYTHQVDQNNYRGPGPSWERNEYVDEDEFEHWGPDGRYNNIKPQGNISHFGRPQNSSGYQDHGRHGNTRWRGHDQRR